MLNFYRRQNIPNVKYSLYFILFVIHYCIYLLVHKILKVINILHCISAIVFNFVPKMFMTRSTELYAQFIILCRHVFSAVYKDIMMINYIGLYKRTYVCCFSCFLMPTLMINNYRKKRILTVNSFCILEMVTYPHSFAISFHHFSTCLEIFVFVVSF